MAYAYYKALFEGAPEDKLKTVMREAQGDSPTWETYDYAQDKWSYDPSTYASKVMYGAEGVDYEELDEGAARAIVERFGGSNFDARA